MFDSKEFVKKYKKACEEHHKRFEDIKMRGGDTHEYGDLNDEEILVIMLDKEFKKIQENTDVV